MTRRANLLLGLGVVAFAALTTAVGIASGAPPEFLVLDGTLGLTFVVAGLAAAHLRPAAPTGPMLLAAGGLWFVGSYAPTGHPVLTFLGFAFERYYDLVLAALLLTLSAPGHGPRPRSLVALLAFAMAIRSLGRLLLLDPARLPDCPGCPANPFAIWPDQALFEVVEVGANLAIAGLLVLIGIVAIMRLLRTGPVARRIRWPILAAGGFAMAGAAFDRSEYAWTTVTGTPLFEIAEPWAAWLAWSVFGLRVLVPAGFLVGALRLRDVDSALAPFAAELGRPGTADSVAAALRTVLGDPSVRLLRAGPGGGWLDDRGRLVPVPQDADRAAVTPIHGSDADLAAIIHDPALREHPELLDAVVTMLGLALENERLEVELRTQHEAASESTKQFASAATDARRSIERDLETGTQQHLAAALSALRDASAVAADPGGRDGVQRQIDAAIAEVELANRELRALGRGAS